MSAEENPLDSAFAAGLTFPIHAKIVGVNGGTAEVFVENPELFHTLLLRPPIEFPLQWTMTGANQVTIKCSQSARDMDAVFKRVNNATN